MTEIFYAASIRGKPKAGFVATSSYSKELGIGKSGLNATSFRDESAPVPLARLPLFKPWRLWHSEVGWEPYRYPCNQPKFPKTVSINMEFTIPANSTEAHIQYRD